MAEFIDRYTIWSRYGRSEVADDRPVVVLQDGSYSWPVRGYNVRGIARFDTVEEAQAVARTFRPFRDGATAPSVTLYPFYSHEIEVA